MSSSTTYPYEIESNYTYDTGKVALRHLVGDDDTFFAKFNQSIDGNQGIGVLTATGVGSPAIASSKLDLTGDSVKYVDYAAEGNANFINTGCINFKFTPNWTGSPATAKYIFLICNANNDNKNLVQVYIVGTTMYMSLRNSAGGGLVSGNVAFSPTAGTTYEIELNVDTSGTSRLFIDGVESITKTTSSVTRTAAANLLRIGAEINGAGNSDFYISDFVVYDAVKHTAAFTGEVPRTYEVAAQLKLQEASQVFNEDFANDTGFTYDSGKAEFTGGKVQQITSYPDAIFAHDFATKDAKWGDGGTTCTLNSPAVITGGKLDTTPGGYLSVPDASTNFDVDGTFTVRYKYTPKYAGLPAAQKYMFETEEASGVNNTARFQHFTNGGMYLYVYDSAGTVNTMNFGTWNQTQDQEYEIELNVSSGATRLFIDGVQLGTTRTNTWTRDTSSLTKFAIGAKDGGGSPADAYIDDFMVFNTVQHTANYTPGYTINNRYPSSEVTLPVFTHTGVGSITSLTSLVTTEAGSVRYNLQTDSNGYMYWSGSAWASSDGTYAQSSTKADITTNLGSFPAQIGALSSTVRAAFTDANTLSSVDDLTLNHTGNTGYPTDNPSIKTNSSVLASDLSAFAATSTAGGSDLVKYVLCVDGVDKYWTGAAWATSSGYAESNTATEINDNIDQYTEAARVVVKIKAYLHSDDGSTTPNVEETSISYITALVNPTLPGLVTLQGFIYDHDGPVSGTVIQVRPYSAGFANPGVFHNYLWVTLDTTDADGFFSGRVFESETVAKEWEIKIGKQSYRFEMPVSASVVDISALTVTVVEDE